MEKRSFLLNHTDYETILKRRKLSSDIISEFVTAHLATMNYLGGDEVEIIRYLDSGRRVEIRGINGCTARVGKYQIVVENSSGSSDLN